MKWPTPQQEDETIETFARLGLKVMVTELDVDVIPSSQGNQSADISQVGQSRPAASRNPYADGLPDSVQQDLARRYGELFAIFAKHHGDLTRVTFWGVTDGDSWLNGWGRVNYPLLFDRKGQPKPAFDAVIKAASNRSK
jgi:endo-1,4-beta-xylanase